MRKDSNIDDLPLFLRDFVTINLIKNHSYRDFTFNKEKHLTSEHVYKFCVSNMCPLFDWKIVNDEIQAPLSFPTVTSINDDYLYMYDATNESIWSLSFDKGWNSGIISLYGRKGVLTFFIDKLCYSMEEDRTSCIIIGRGNNQDQVSFASYPLYIEDARGFLKTIS